MSVSDHQPHLRLQQLPEGRTPLHFGHFLSLSWYISRVKRSRDRRQRRAHGVIEPVGGAAKPGPGPSAQLGRSNAGLFKFSTVQLWHIPRQGVLQGWTAKPQTPRIATTGAIHQGWHQPSGAPCAKTARKPRTWNANEPSRNNWHSCDLPVKSLKRPAGGMNGVTGSLLSRSSLRLRICLLLVNPVVQCNTMHYFR